MFKLLFQVDPAVPDLKRRKIHEREHVFAISRHCARRSSVRSFVRQIGCLGRHGDARRQTLDVHSEIDARQRLIEIIDVEEDIVFGRVERAEVHQVTVATGLHWRSRHRLMGEIGRHHRRGAAQEPEGGRYHALVALGQKLRHPLGVGFRQDSDGVAIPGPMQLSMGFAQDAGSQLSTVLVSLGAVLRRCGHDEKPPKA